MNNLKLALSSLATAATLALSLSAVADTTPWSLDPTHSRVGFEISHMVISTVSGRFKEVSADVKLDEENLAKSSVSVTVQAKSIDTDEPKRDDHLRSPEFFDVAKFPTITFASSSIKAAGGEKYKLSGDLSIHGISKPVTLDATISKAVKNPWGKMVRGVKLTGKIKRSDFGLTWNKALETGGLVVGDEVKLVIQAEVNK